jgi:uncharacterized Zn finger protein (UPF0148 family)
MSMPGIELKRALFGGGYTVGYECPNCKTRLKSPLDDAGKTDTCPDCKQTFVVPGSQERDQLRWQAEQEETARKRKLLAEQEAQAELRKKQARAEEDRRLQAEPAVAEFFYDANGAEQGPLTADEILQRYESHAIHAETSIKVGKDGRKYSAAAVVDRVKVLAGRQPAASEHPLDLPELTGAPDPLGNVADLYADRATLAGAPDAAESHALELLVNQIDRLAAEAAKQTRYLDEIRAHVRIFFWVYILLPLVCGVIWFAIYLAASHAGR